MPSRNIRAKSSVAIGLAMSVLLGLPLPARAGPLFTVNTTTDGARTAADVVAVGVNGFVVVWQGPDDDGSGIFARRFAQDGAPIGDQFAVNTVTEGNQTSPRIAADGSGRYVISFTSTTGTGARRQLARRYSASGVAIDVKPVTVPISFVDATLGVAADGSAAFVGYGTNAPVNDAVPVRMRRFSFDGAALGPEVTVGLGSTLNGRSTAICFHADGSFAVSYSAPANAAFEHGAQLQRFSASGGTVSQTRFGVAPQDPISGHSLACLENGGYAATFSDLFEGNLNLASTYVQAFDAGGSTIGELREISDTTTPRGDNGSAPDIAAIPGGGFEVIWNRYLVLEGDGENPDIFEFQIQGQRFTANGMPSTARLRIDQAPFPLARARFPAVAVGSLKRFGVWRSSIGPDRTPTDIIGRTLP